MLPDIEKCKIPFYFYNFLHFGQRRFISLHPLSGFWKRPYCWTR